MALINCYECQAMMSEFAAACPHCGAPARTPSVQTPAHAQTAPHSTVSPSCSQPAESVGGWLKQLLWLSVFVIASGIVFRIFGVTIGLTFCAAWIAWSLISSDKRKLRAISTIAILIVGVATWFGAAKTAVKYAPLLKHDVIRVAPEHSQEPIAKAQLRRASESISNDEASSATDNACLKDGGAVEFTGNISRETFPGPPNYESIDNGDKPETYWILTVNTPRCVTAESMEDGTPYEIAKSTTRFQLAFEDAAVYELQKTLVENDAIVTGQLFAGHTGHHHTKALISVKEIRPQGGQIQ